MRNNSETDKNKSGQYKAVRVKGGMRLRNGMWHGLRADIIIRNLIYGKWRKEINQTGKHAHVSARPSLAPNLKEQSPG